MLAVLEPGDEVLTPDPGFPTYQEAIRLVGAKPVPIPLMEEKGFDLDLDAFDRALSARSRMIILNSPGNPTGGVLSPETLRHVAAAARKHDCWVLSDEIYLRLAYDGQPMSIASLPDMAERTIIADGFSKTYAMTGWRLGFGLMPTPLAEKIDLLLTHSTGCTATFVQYAGLEAITGPQDQVDAMVDVFRGRRDLIVDQLNRIPGIQCPTPRGAFYVFPNVASFGRPCEEIADFVLEEAGVALLPGTSFGAQGRGHLRLSYANSSDNIRLAMERMAAALARLG
jgi:aspartate/methionine/tyrosine aminotransferase